MTDESDVIVTRAFMESNWGIYALAFMQVCAHCEVPPEIVERRANELNPSGVSHAWKITSVGPHDADISPKQCESDPARIHYMLSC